MQDFGKKFRELRLARGMTMKDVAEAAGLSQSALSYIENGTNRPTIDTAEKILKTMGLTLGDFFTDGFSSKPLPPDITQFSLDKNNHALIRLIQGMKAAGYSNELIGEWLSSLNNTLMEITKTYNIKPGEVVWDEEDLAAEEREDMERFKEKIKAQREKISRERGV